MGGSYLDLDSQHMQNNTMRLLDLFASTSMRLYVCSLDTPLGRGSSLGTLCVRGQVCLCVGSNTLTRTPSPTAVLTTNLGPYAVPPLRMRVQSLESRVDI